MQLFPLLVPAGSDSQIQYNNGGIFGGDSALTWNDSTKALTVGSCAVLGPNSAVFQPAADSTTFFQVLDADGGTPVLNVDSTNERVGIGTASPYSVLTLGGATGTTISRDRANSVISFLGGTGATDSAYFSVTGNSNSGSPGLGSIEFVIRNNAGTDTSRSKWILYSYNGVSAWTPRFCLIGETGNIGIGQEFYAETITEWTTTVPYLTLHNSTHEDTNGGGESRIIGKREDGAGTETAAGQIEFAHDGAGANDQLGRMVFSVNSGAALAEVLRLDSGLGTVIAGANHLHLRDSAIGIYSQADTFMDLFADGGVRIGDSSAGAPTNYAKFAPDGELNLVGTARVTKEYAIQAIDLTPGTAGATLTNVGNYAGYAFTINDDMLGVFEVPHDWDSSTAIEVYIVWAINEAYATGNGEVQWRVRWSATPFDSTEAINAPTHTGTIDFGDQNIPATAYYLTRTSAGSIAAASLAAEDLIGFTLDRVALDGGNNPVAEPILLHLQIHYTANKLGVAT